MGLCETCSNAVWDTIEYHSAKECGLYGGNKAVIEDCRKSDLMSDAVAKEWVKDIPDVRECENYKEVCDE